MWEQIARLVLLMTSHMVFPLCPAGPCTVNSAIMTTHNIAFMHSLKDTLYAPHNDHIQFRCTRGNPVDSSSMRRKCVDGAMPLPSCNWSISLNGHAVGGAWERPFTATQWWACIWLWIKCLLLPSVFPLWTVDFTFIVPPSCIQPELACYSLPRSFTRLPFVSPGYVSSSKKSFQPVFVPATK